MFEGADVGIRTFEDVLPVFEFLVLLLDSLFVRHKNLNII